MLQRTMAIVALALAVSLLLAGPAAAQQGWMYGGSDGFRSTGGYSGGYSGYSSYGGYGYRPMPTYYAPAYTSVPAYVPTAPFVAYRSSELPGGMGYVSTAAPVADGLARITVTVPPDAKLTFSGDKTVQTGTVRRFEATELVPGRQYSYEVKATWKEQGREMIRSRHITFRAGDVINLTFGDRVEAR
jgi:uncharacterized protein (TIGR03000 family)